MIAVWRKFRNNPLKNENFEFPSVFLILAGSAKYFFKILAKNWKFVRTIQNWEIIPYNFSPTQVLPPEIFPPPAPYAQDIQVVGLQRPEGQAG